MKTRRFFGSAALVAAAALAPAAAQAVTISFASFEDEVVFLVNIQRAAVGLAALGMDTRLAAAAEAHSIDMATNDCFQHNSCNGGDWATRVFSYYPSAGIGENVAAGYTTAASVVDGWMNSPGHKANILNASYQGIGVGYYALAGSDYTHYWTQDFGTLTPLAAVPEPGSYAMLLAGLGLIGAIAHRRLNK